MKETELKELRHELESLLHLYKGDKWSRAHTEDVMDIFDRATITRPSDESKCNNCGMTEGHLAPCPNATEQIEELAEILHSAYLIAIAWLKRDGDTGSTGNFNPNAVKPFEELTEEQKHIDKHIAKILLNEGYRRGGSNER